MKSSFSLMLIAFVLVLNMSCEKDPTYQDGNGSSNYAPNANAGADFFVWSPVDGAKLNGSYSDLENNVKAVSWEKIFGPNSFTLANKDSLSAKISGLEQGLYKFELTVTDEGNLVDKDTVSVLVAGLSGNPQEVIFRDLEWISPWYNNIEIKNFVGHGTPGNAPKVFIQRENDPAWLEVVPTDNTTMPANSYDYFVMIEPHAFYNGGSLYISYYGSDVNDTPNVKIVY